VSEAAARGALEAVDRIVNRGGEADDVLRATVAVLHERLASWAGISFVEEGALVLGPSAGEPNESERVSVPVTFKGDRVAELAVDGYDDRAVLERVATLISPYALVGWDTAGEPWEP
jgi:hypothetical protein